MNKLLKIDNIMYKVKDLQKSSDFYQNVLGLKKVWEDQSYKMIGFVFEQSDSEIVIHSDPNLPNFDYCFLVDDVISFCNEFKEKGFKLADEPFEVRPGKFAVLENIDGNKIPIIDLSKFGGKPKYD